MDLEDANCSDIPTVSRGLISDKRIFLSTLVTKFYICRPMAASLVAARQRAGASADVLHSAIA